MQKTVFAVMLAVIVLAPAPAWGQEQLSLPPGCNDEQLAEALKGLTNLEWLDIDGSGRAEFKLEDDAKIARIGWLARAENGSWHGFAAGRMGLAPGVVAAANALGERIVVERDINAHRLGKMKADQYEYQAKLAHLRLADLLRGPSRHVVDTPLDAKLYQDEVVEGLKTLKAFLTGCAELAEPQRIEI